MQIEQIIGTWRLKEFTISANGKTKPWKEDMHGLLMYNSDGYMSVAINSKTDVLFYAGKYTIADDSVIIHSVLNATEESRINKDLLRDFVLEKNKLSLTSTGDFGTANLVWEKI